MSFVWTFEACKAEAAKYQTRGEYKKKCKSYGPARRKGWLNEICAHMTKVNVSWTKEMCQAEALKYSSRLEYQKSCPSYKAARRAGFLDEICAHMNPVPVRWTKEMCRVEAAKYQTRGEYSKSCSSYQAAYKKGWLDDICQHMNSPQVPRGYWTKERVAEVASEFSARSEFQKGNPSAYATASQNGWLDDVCAHMLVKRVTWTKEMCREEAAKYQTRTEYHASCSSYYAALKNGWLDEVCAHMTSVTLPHGYWTKERVAAVAAQACTRSEFQAINGSAYGKARANGWLADVCLHMGGEQEPSPLWSKEECAAAAAQCKSRSEFSEKFPKLAVVARARKWTEEICSHFEPTVRERYWTKDRIAQLAASAATRAELKRKSHYAYKIALENGWLDEICSHMGIHHVSNTMWTKAQCAEAALQCSSRTEFVEKFPNECTATYRRGWHSDICAHFTPRKSTHNTKIGDVFNSWTALENRAEKVLCRCECGNERRVSNCDLHNGRSKSCGCMIGSESISEQEQTLADWIKNDLGLEVIQQFPVNGFLFDVCVPEAGLLIEYNGVYWHSSARTKNRSQHKYKRRQGEEAGYRVINIWEDDWFRAESRIKRLIKRACGLSNETKVGARKVSMEQTSFSEANDFHASHHVQSGNANGFVHYFVVHEGKPIAAATIAERRMSGETFYDLARMTVDTNYSVAGLVGKIIATVNREFGSKNWVSYCDRDYFDGKLYRAAGFEYQSTSLQMTYAYKKERVRREKFMRHKLGEMFSIDLAEYDHLSERDICEMHGVYQCYNSGIDKYILRVAA